jgi:hypothetical protein
VAILQRTFSQRPREGHTRRGRKQRTLIVTIIAAVRGRRAPVATHVYTLPVVRELPVQPPTAAQHRAW